MKTLKNYTPSAGESGAQPLPSSSAEKCTQGRKAFVAPKLERHDKLPVITAGSLTGSNWGF